MLWALADQASADVVHADVKPGNVLLASDPPPSPHFKIGGFRMRAQEGKSRRAPRPGAERVPSSEILPRSGSVLGLTPTSAVDRWAAECVLFELYTGNVCFPAASKNALLCAIIDARSDIPAHQQSICLGG